MGKSDEHREDFEQAGRGAVRKGLADSEGHPYGK
jgi:hypothetical protein